jgi:outer membrane immunogenic protein
LLMKSHFLGLLAATAISTAAVSAASAADLPVRAAPPAPIFAPAPVFTWTGFYAGVNAGWGWRDDDE